MPIHTKIAEQIQAEIERYLETKEGLDSIVNLSKEEKNTVSLSVDKVESIQGYMTLLSEGSILYQDGTIRLFITKGTLQKWYDSIDDSFQGYVTTGHTDLNATPVREGYFNKSDLKIVTDSNGRSDLLVKPHVNLELSKIKDLIIQDEPFAISSEFEFSYVDEDNLDIEEYSKLIAYNLDKGGSVYFPVTDEINLLGFSFVANPGNAKSGGYEPSLLVRNEEEHLNKKDLLNKVLEHLSQEATVSEEEVEQAEATETEALENKEVEEQQEEEKEVEVEEEKVDETAELLAKATETIETLTAKVEALEAELAKYKENEKAVDEQFSKLEKLLTKASVVEAPKEEKEDKAKLTTTEHGLRKRFGGLI